MTLNSETKTHIHTIYLDGTFLELRPEEEAFFKAETGIQDTEELKKHIAEVQDGAYKVSSWSRADLAHLLGAVMSRFLFRSTRILAFVGSDS